MESCNKELSILDGRDGKVVFSLKCCDGKYHEGECQFSVWTNGFNSVTNKNGLITIIKLNPTKEEGVEGE